MLKSPIATTTPTFISRCVETMLWLNPIPFWYLHVSWSSHPVPFIWKSLRNQQIIRIEATSKATPLSKKTLYSIYNQSIIFEIPMNFVDIPACYLHFYLPVFSPRKSAPGQVARSRTWAASAPGRTRQRGARAGRIPALGWTPRGPRGGDLTPRCFLPTSCGGKAMGKCATSGGKSWERKVDTLW